MITIAHNSNELLKVGPVALRAAESAGKGLAADHFQPQPAPAQNLHYRQKIPLHCARRGLDSRAHHTPFQIQINLGGHNSTHPEAAQNLFTFHHPAFLDLRWP